MAFFLKNKLMGMIPQISDIDRSLLNKCQKINKLKGRIQSTGIFVLIAFNPCRDFT